MPWLHKYSKSNLREFERCWQKNILLNFLIGFSSPNMSCKASSHSSIFHLPLWRHYKPRGLYPGLFLMKYRSLVVSWASQAKYKQRNWHDSPQLKCLLSKICGRFLMISSSEFRLLTVRLKEEWNRLSICSRHRRVVEPKLPGRRCQTACLQR